MATNRLVRFSEVNAETYYLWTLLLVIGAVALLAFASGVSLGWLMWSKYRRRAQVLNRNNDLLRDKIRRLTA